MLQITKLITNNAKTPRKARTRDNEPAYLHDDAHMSCRLGPRGERMRAHFRGKNLCKMRQMARKQRQYTAE